MKIVRCLLLLFVLCGSSRVFAAAAANGPVHPNIILIVADGLGYGDLSCYGQDKLKTTNIDRLAAEGTRFTQFYAGASVGPASRAVLLTGKHAGHSRIRGSSPENVSLEADDYTLGQLVKKADYVTGAIGEWELGTQGSTGTPSRKSFDEWFGTLTAAESRNYYPGMYWRDTGQVVTTDINGGNGGIFAPDFYARASTNFVRLYAATKQHPQRRFFLYLATPAPRIDLNNTNEVFVPDGGAFANQRWSSAEKSKAAMITRLDAGIGQLLETLKKTFTETNTVIFFTSGSGPQKLSGTNAPAFNSTGPLRGSQGDLLEGGIRVPMIVWWPGKVPAGRISDQPWAFCDVMSTMAELTGTLAPDDTDGISMAQMLFGYKQAAKREFLYWESFENGFQQAVRYGDWKAIRNGLNQPLALYDLKTNPGETKNVAAQHPEVVAKIEAYLKTARTDSKEWPVK